jgi:lactate racemase
MALMLAEGSFIGETERNPFVAEIREAGRLAKLDFIVNAIFDADEEVKSVVAGHFTEAHRAGTELCAKELAVRFDEPSDVTIMSAFPYIDGPQILKPLAATNAITRAGGTIILFADKIRGGRFSPTLLDAFDKAFAKADGDIRKMIADHIREGKLIVPGIQIDFNSALNCTLLYGTRNRLFLVSEDADEEQASRLGFQYVSSLQEAVDRTARDRPAAKVNILPMGGVVMPIVPESMRTKWLD